MARPVKDFDKKLFCDLVSIGCVEDEICWIFRDAETGKPANRDTLSRWCKREFGKSFQEFSQQNRAMGLRTKLRGYQLELAKRSAAMAIWLGKQYLGQKDTVDEENAAEKKLDALLDKIGGVV